MIGSRVDAEVSEPKRRDETLLLKRLIEDSDLGYLNDRVEQYLPDSLFGPPTSAEAGEAARKRNDHRAVTPSRRLTTPAARRKRVR